ncbi:MAG: PepSY domain-containing protein [Steroidobacteraceae bacterium]
MIRIRIPSLESALAAALLIAAAPLALAAARGSNDTGPSASTSASTDSDTGAETGTSTSPEHTQSDSAHHHHRAALHEHSAQMGAPPAADVKPFETAKLLLTQAISAAQKEMRGKTLSARFEVWHGTPAYLIRTYSAHQVWESRINAESGDAIGKPETVAESELGPKAKSDIAALANAETDLTDAVDKAERQQGGKAIMARVRTDSKGNAAYDLGLVKEGKIHTAMVDASSGQLR